jgi:hypothetical protein
MKFGLKVKLMLKENQVLWCQKWWWNANWRVNQNFMMLKNEIKILLYKYYYNFNIKFIYKNTMEETHQ